MRIYSLEERSNESLYEYLYECIKNDILDGTLKPNEKLPSKRSFANNQGISVVTVENTYGQLLAEGYIYSKPKCGFYVSVIENQIQNKEPKIAYNYAKKDIIDTSLYNLISNKTAMDNFPFSVWAKIMRRLLTEQNDELLTSPPTGGVYSLRVAIAEHLLSFRGIECDPEQIIIGAGTEYLYSLIVQLLGRNQIYGLENPSSQKIRNIYEALGVKTIPLSMDKEGIKLSSENLTLPSIIQISPSHQFPLGLVTSVNRRYGLLDWASERENRYIIEDDYDSEFRLQGRPIPSLFSMDTTEKVIYFNTFTKSLSSTIRISYMILPKPLLEKFKNNLSFYACTVSNFEQYTLAAFIKEGYFDRHINRMRNHYRELRDELTSLLKSSSIGQNISIHEADSGIHFLLKYDGKKTDSELKKLAENNGLKISFVSDYLSLGYEPDDNRYNNLAIINYSGLNKADIPKVAEALSASWE